MGILSAIKSLFATEKPSARRITSGYDEFKYCPACYLSPPPPVSFLCPDRSGAKVCEECGEMLSVGVGRIVYVYIDHHEGHVGLPPCIEHIESRFYPKGTDIPTDSPK